jgi:hypothetical protein
MAKYIAFVRSNSQLEIVKAYCKEHGLEYILIFLRLGISDDFSIDYPQNFVKRITKVYSLLNHLGKDDYFMFPYDNVTPFYQHEGDVNFEEGLSVLRTTNNQMKLWNTKDILKFFTALLLTGFNRRKAMFISGPISLPIDGFKYNKFLTTFSKLQPREKYRRVYIKPKKLELNDKYVIRVLYLEALFIRPVVDVDQYVHFVKDRILYDNGIFVKIHPRDLTYGKDVKSRISDLLEMEIEFYDNPSAENIIIYAVSGSAIHYAKHFGLGSVSFFVDYMDLDKKLNQFYLSNNYNIPLLKEALA